ncbi:amidohydrolase family protein [Nocardioides soli]|uniref:Amidohydrolase-related domain-containing protein n=1 Tax=Nocardioides soli TaxID=1036020 RepID=A0A7W4Z2Z2_9ACTN|nr:amidohydrolase family protein [Nocardioides soli]MBB3043145.1 hypothetical protein [Nocardioides soli]
MSDIAAYVDGLGLVDHHCHGVVSADLDLAGFEGLATESSWPSPFGGSNFDTPFGVAVRALCAPLLDLPKHSSGAAYVARRSELGPEEVNRRLLGATGIDTYIIETGVGGSELLGAAEIGAATGAAHREVHRLEVIAERLLEQVGGGDEFVTRLTDRLDESAAVAVGFKSVVAYRHGLDFDPARPGLADVRRAADAVVARRTDGARVRLTDETIIRHLLWEAVDRRRPLQFHVGYGDSDIDLYRCDPSRMTEFIRRTVGTGTAITLLHCYPFQREAAFLAQVYPHVYLDTGAAVNYTGFGSAQVVRESLELAPFNKVLFSTDAYGLPELYLCGSLLWRRAVTRIFSAWVDADEMGAGDAVRYLDLIASGNAQNVYADV